MRNIQKLLIAAAICCSPFCGHAGVWTAITADQAPQKLQLMHPSAFLAYTLDETTLKAQLFALPNGKSSTIVSLPMPDGSFRDFKVWQTPMMPDELVNQFPDIRTFTGEAVGNATITAKLDFTLYGFHAMIFNGENTSFVDPYDNFHDGYYMVHYMRNETRQLSDMMKCLNHAKDEHNTSVSIAQASQPKVALKTVNGSQLRTYRLALAADSFYSGAVTYPARPTTAAVFSKMTTSMNRINGVYEREFSVTMTFVNNESSIIFLTAASDPYYADNDLASNLLMDNQTELDAVIGNANYDVGHVFTTGSGGLSDVGVVCETGFKANSTTGQPNPVGDGFDIDFVAHEMGHEFGGDHTFNNGLDGSCAGNNVSTIAYEPGSGSTIMCYAGICMPDDVQPHSDAYFHGESLFMIQQYIATENGNTCPVKTATGNKLVSYPPFTATYSIPFETPFELDAPVLADSVADTSVLYCWEEWDLPSGVDDGARFVNTHYTGPIFRSYSPTTGSRRIFPHNSMILAGTLSNAGTDNNEGEKVPDVARTLTFKPTFRDIYNGNGSFTIPDDEITLNAVNTGSGFTVSSQNATGVVYTGGSTQTITWNVVGTNSGTINAANVDIYMAVDGGNIWYYHLGTFPNTGSASVTIPNPAVNSVNCRIKIKGTGNVFFNVNSTNFTVNNDPSIGVSAGVGQVTQTADISVYPVPATNSISVHTTGIYHSAVYDVVGRQMWSGDIAGQQQLSVASWPRGTYYLQLRNTAGQVALKRIVLQ